MNFAEILQNEETLVIARSGDLKELAIAAVEYYKSSNQVQEVKEPAGPVSQSDAAKILNRSRQTLVKWRKKGILKGFLIGGRVFFRPEDIAAIQRIHLS
jgi:hypothetical protein